MPNQNSTQPVYKRSLSSFCCPHEETLRPLLSKMWPVNILIRLCECAGWSEFSLGTHVRRYVVWSYGSFHFVPVDVPKWWYLNNKQCRPKSDLKEQFDQCLHCWLRHVCQNIKINTEFSLFFQIFSGSAFSQLWPQKTTEISRRTSSCTRHLNCEHWACWVKFSADDILNFFFFFFFSQKIGIEIWCKLSP